MKIKSVDFNKIFFNKTGHYLLALHSNFLNDNIQFSIFDFLISKFKFKNLYNMPSQIRYDTYIYIIHNTKFFYKQIHEHVNS